MGSIPFDVNDGALRAVFLGRLMAESLARLRPDEPPRWGGMAAQQMVEHLEWVFGVSTGRVVLECPVPEARRERLKRFLYDATPTPHEFRNPALVAGLPALRHAGLPEARQALSLAVARFLDASREEPEARHVHPVFGPLGVEEWSRSHFKHGYHHLLQFGLLEPMSADTPAGKAERSRGD